MFLERREMLVTGAPRVATRAIDKQALAVLDRLGFDDVEIMRLHALVREGRATITFSGKTTAAADYLVAVRKMYAWVTAWSEVARTVVTRRDHLIRLGLAKRRLKAAV